MMRGTGVFILCLFSLPACAAGVYKWVDENGQVHYSQKPPQKKEAKKLGEAISKSSEANVKAIGKCTTLSQQLVGDWRGKDGENRIVFRFYERRGRFSGKNTEKGFYIDYGRQSLLQGGLWKTRGTEVLFTIKKIGRAAKQRAMIEKVMVANIDPNNLYLLAGDEEFRLRRYHGAGNRPSCFK